MDPTVKQQLIDAALGVRLRAHAPYSEFGVGAAVLTEGGRTFTGCNVENASYGMTICAERAAVCAAVAGSTPGARPTIVAVAVATKGGHSPCGACRQVLAEFQPADGEPPMEVVMIDSENPALVRVMTLAALLPEQFDARGLADS